MAASPDDPRANLKNGVQRDSDGRPAISLLQSGGPAGSRLRWADSAFVPDAENAASLYIHIPFCFHKCHYCDFYSIEDTQNRQAVFAHRLIEELHAIGSGAGRPRLETIFVGGGTPSLLKPGLWVLVLECLGTAFDMAAFAPAGRMSGEFTVECNPETVTDELMQVLSSGGVNRVSMGAQSFHERHLKTLERWHNPANVAAAIGRARNAGIARQSVDLIFGIPGQTLDDWHKDLETALALGVTHMSCYSLTYEPGTAMTARLHAGQFARIDEDLDADMFLHTGDHLSAAGLKRYEISNFAVPGHECRHNLAYWRMNSWLAAGPSASGNLLVNRRAHAAPASVRWKNIPRLADYLAQSRNGFAPIVEFEPPDALRLVRERLMMGLRLAEGVDGTLLLSHCEAASPRAAESLSSAAEHAARDGLLLMQQGRWRIARHAVAITDTVIGRLIRAAHEA